MRESINKSVFFTTFLVILVTIISCISYPQQIQQFTAILQNQIVHFAGWLYILIVGLFLLFLTFLAISKYGDIKLGQDHATPEHSYLSWLAMLFSAGMGVGIIYYGLSEPVMHYNMPPVDADNRLETAKQAMRITFFHWGLHPWAIYSIFALPIAYFSYRHDLPLLPRSILYPLIGDKIYGPIGNTVDIFTASATIFGIATSLGMSATQVNSGLHEIFDTPMNMNYQGIIIFVITIISSVSVALGIKKGIKRLSNANMLLALLLLIFVILNNSPIYILKTFVENTGSYFSNIIEMTFNLYAYERNEEWMGGWTLAYWSWWLSWSPFVGMFIARISKGRTVREFIIAVLLMPSVSIFLWFTAFGNTAINFLERDLIPNFIHIVSKETANSIFHFLKVMPSYSISSILAIILMITFFVSSADSGSLIMNTLTSKHNKSSPKKLRIFWSCCVGFISWSIMYTGGIEALQAINMAASLPILFILAIFCYSFYKALNYDFCINENLQSNISLKYTKYKTNWREYVSSLNSYPQKKETKDFMENTAYEAIKELAEEMEKQKIETKVSDFSNKEIGCTIYVNENDSFYYGIKIIEYILPDYIDEDYSYYNRAEVFLDQGGQQYNIINYEKEQIISDIISQYERYKNQIELINIEKRL